MKTITGDGQGRQQQLDMEHLSEIVDTLNERFGLNLDEREPTRRSSSSRRPWLADPDVIDQARNNTLENFRLVFDREFMKTVVGRMDMNEAIFKRILDDEESAKA